MLKRVGGAFKQVQRPGKIGQVKICAFNLLRDRSAKFFGLCALRVRFAVRNLALETQLAGVGQFLGSAEADIGEVAVRETGKRLSRNTVRLKILIRLEQSILRVRSDWRGRSG